MKKFHKFTNNSFRIVITWKTRKIQSFFPLKNKIDYELCVIYTGDCSCGLCYVGETKHNAEVSWNEHDNEATSVTILHGLSFQMLQKMLKPQRT